MLCRSFLSAGDAAVLKRQLAPGHLMHELRSRDRFSCRFHSMPDPAGHEFFEVQVSRKEVTEDSFRILLEALSECCKK